jgi:hypothetical protein
MRLRAGRNRRLLGKDLTLVKSCAQDALNVKGIFERVQIFARIVTAGNRKVLAR